MTIPGLLLFFLLPFGRRLSIADIELPGPIERRVRAIPCEEDTSAPLCLLVLFGLRKEQTPCYGSMFRIHTP